MCSVLSDELLGGSQMMTNMRAKCEKQTKLNTAANVVCVLVCSYVLCVFTFQLLYVYIKGFQPEWCISTILVYIMLEIHHSRREPLIFTHNGSHIESVYAHGGECMGMCKDGCRWVIDSIFVLHPHVFHTATASECMIVFVFF